MAPLRPSSSPSCRASLRSVEHESKRVRDVRLVLSELKRALQPFGASFGGATKLLAHIVVATMSNAGCLCSAPSRCRSASRRTAHPCAHLCRAFPCRPSRRVVRPHSRTALTPAPAAREPRFSRATPRFLAELCLCCLERPSALSRASLTWYALIAIVTMSASPPSAWVMLLLACTPSSASFSSLEIPARRQRCTCQRGMSQIARPTTTSAQRTAAMIARVVTEATVAHLAAGRQPLFARGT